MNYLRLIVRYFSLTLSLIVCLLSFSEELYSQSRSDPRRNSAPLKILNSNRAKDGLRGPVRRLRTEVARVKFNTNGPVEGERTLLELTVYEISGKRIDNKTYPVVNSPIGQETYDYDEAGRLLRTTVRNEQGVVLSRTEYSYEFDAAGNWVKMISSVVVSESGQQRLEPVEVAYRTITYYPGDDAGAPAVVEENASLSQTVLTHAGTDSSPRSERVAGGSKGVPSSSSKEPSQIRLGAAASTTVEIDKLPDVGLINDKALSLPPPAYPINWRKAATPIIVTVEVVIDETGRVIHSRGVEGPQELWRVAEAAARRAGFLPFRSERRPSKVKGLLNYSFPFDPR
ncbi:MAG: hypothetical protein LC803_19150 [Acidobacteria bacterium]|nr:hypothetical protein [Acidobacteriota bacterium]